MRLVITLTSHEGTVSLREAGAVLATRTFAVDGDLSQKILLEIEALLVSENVEFFTLQNAECIADEAGLTTTRIGNVVANTMNLALQSPKKAQ